MLVRGYVPQEIKRSVQLWVGCVAGALSDREYVAKLVAAGFERPEIEVTRTYSVEDARELLTGQGPDIDALAKQVDGKFVSGFVRAVKPAVNAESRTTPHAAASQEDSSACCSPSCCGDRS